MINIDNSDHQILIKLIVDIRHYQIIYIGTDVVTAVDEKNRQTLKTPINDYDNNNNYYICTIVT